ncbi:hypothetical protein ACJIZ3_005826 [Penstemon smallii]|uniref:Uncharacterized protein n=1 Tax=Penstemon smallii TaxID=265156 RepID=A0ABD3S5Z0_9LAMI
MKLVEFFILLCVHLETYLFNPPFISAPIEMIPDENVKSALRILKSVIAAGLAAAKHGGSHSEDQENNDPFTVLSKWIPYLFINQSDPICSEYAGYFEYREKMEKIGMEKLAATSSIGNIFTSTLGIDSEATHLIPSAYLSINSSPCNGFKEAHGINQWWKIDLELKDKLYQYK